MARKMNYRQRPNMAVRAIVAMEQMSDDSRFTIGKLLNASLRIEPGQAWTRYNTLFRQLHRLKEAGLVKVIGKRKGSKELVWQWVGPANEMSSRASDVIELNPDMGRQGTPQ